MYRSIMMTIVWMLFAFHIFAQQEEKVKGIFRTGKDVMQNSISFDVGCNAGKNKIKLNELFLHKYIYIKNNDSCYHVLKDSIYGYQTCDNNIHRYFMAKDLLMLNRGENIILYRWILPRVTESRTNITSYYYSLGDTGIVKSLTIKNLKNSFVNNVFFLNSIDQHFRYNTDLAKFDKENKMYRINYLLRQSLK